jgi:hypothetical protein
MSDGAVMGVGTLVTLGGAFMAQGVWGVVTVFGFILMLFGFGGYFADYIIRGARRGG